MLQGMIVCVSHCRSCFVHAEFSLNQQIGSVSGQRSQGWCVLECCTIRAAVLTAISSTLISMTGSLAWRTRLLLQRWEVAYFCLTGLPFLNCTRSIRHKPEQQSSYSRFWGHRMMACCLTDAYMFNLCCVGVMDGNTGVWFSAPL